MDNGAALMSRLSLRGFLVARFIAMLAWVVLLVLGYLGYRALAPHVSTEWARWLLNLATLAAAIALGYVIQRRVLAWLDPDGELRREVRRASERDLARADDA